MNITPDAWQADTEALRARAEKAEARIQAVEAAIETHGHPDDWGVQCVYVSQLRAALDGSPHRPCGRGPCALGHGHTGDCTM